jgi:hypothetical protein
MRISGRRRGIILVTTLFFMMLFFMLAFGIYTMSPRQDDRAMTRDKTVTEAHFACGAGIRMAKEWISAVTKPANSANAIDTLGQDWNSGPSTATFGTTTIYRTHNDIFSVPNTDPNFNIVGLNTLSCPNNRFAGKTGIDYLGLAPDANLTTTDYNYIKSNQGNWPVLKSSPLKVGEYQVYTYLLPSAKAVDSARGVSGDGLKTFLVVSIAYRSNLPVLRARCLLKEVSSSKYAYRTNAPGLDTNGNPISWVVSSADSVLFDGPVHTNGTPVVSVSAGYWNAALTYFPGDSLRQKPKRAFMGGSLTFSGTNTSLSPNFDGVAWQGGNFNGTDNDRRPHDASGGSIASTAQGSNPTPLDGRNIENRYDRLIEGGRESIRKIPTVPLPADLTILKQAAWGADSQTGLSTTGAPNTWGVDATQKNGSVQNTTVVRQSYRNSSGNVVNASTLNNASAADTGIFINPVAGTQKAAGGVAIKGDTRNMYLEITDSTGKLVTTGYDNQTLANAHSSNTTIGNPTIRVQSTIDSYDSDSGTAITNYTSNGSTTGTWVATQNAVYHPTQNGNWVATQNAVYHATVPGNYVNTVNAVFHPTVNGVWREPTGSGSGSGYWDPPTQNAYTTATVNGYWNPATQNAWTQATVNGYTANYQAAYTTPTVDGYTQGGGNTVWTANGTVLDPFRYKAQDWVVDVKNVSSTIQPSIPIPTITAQRDAWRKGVGGELNNGDGNTHQAEYLGNTPEATGKGITKVYLHGQNDTAGSLVSSPITVPTGKIIVYKQSRSDANRLDVFVLDNPKPAPGPGEPPKPGLNGAVYGTGDINGLRGVNLEAKSIGVDYSTDKGIGIVDSILQYGVAKGEKPINAYHGLGLVGTKMNVQTNESRYQDKSLYIYATIIAGKSGNTGGMDVSNSNNDTTTTWSRLANTTNTDATRRTLQIFGGLTEQITKARLVGSTSGSRGWNQQMNFDKHLSFLPPPFFPTTNQLTPLAYYQEVVIGQ